MVRTTQLEKIVTKDSAKLHGALLSLAALAESIQDLRETKREEYRSQVSSPRFPFPPSLIQPNRIADLLLYYSNTRRSRLSSTAQDLSSSSFRRFAISHKLCSFPSINIACARKFEMDRYIASCGRSDRRESSCSSGRSDSTGIRIDGLLESD